MTIPKPIEQSATNPQFRAWLAQHLKLNHSGRENGVKLEVLMSETFGPGYASRNENRIIRRAIEIINHDDNGLVVSDTEAGYWWAASLQDGLDAVEKNKSRAKTILENASRVECNLMAAYGGQMGLL